MLPKPGLILLDYDDTVVTIRDDFERFALQRISDTFGESAGVGRRAHRPVPHVELTPKFDSILDNVAYALNEKVRPLLAGMAEDLSNYNLKPGFSAFSAFVQSEEIPLLLASASPTAPAQKSMMHFHLAFAKSVFRDDPRYGTFEKPEMVSGYLRGQGVKIDAPVWVIGNGHADFDTAKALARNEAAGQPVYMIAMGRNCQLALHPLRIHADETPNLQMIIVEDFDDLLKKTATAPGAAKPATASPNRKG
jgi:hypothetical protein